ncbi:MAG: fumarate reductase subunit D [Armatimonadetes bacterium]|nr:fumarate reductase subunit D [Armatimonadota bacterium]
MSAHTVPNPLPHSKGGRTHEPFWWSLFSAGGVVAAFVMPVLIFLTGLAGAFGWGAAQEAFTYDHIANLISNPLIKIFLFVCVSLPLFHCAHRIRHSLVDVGLGGIKTPLAVVSYLSAAVLTVFCAFVLLRI